MEQTGYRRPRPLAMQNVSRKSRQDPRPEVDPTPEETSKLGIDLNSSPALKFLVPRELQRSPLSPFTPAAVPFGWEEAPGKPKERAPDVVERCSMALHLPPRLLQRTTHPQSPPEEGDARHRRSASAGSPEEKRVICVQKVEKIQENRSPGCLVSSLDCQLSHYSPLRALGPPPPEDLHWGAKASALITMWRKNSSAKHKSKHNDNMKNKTAKSFDPKGEERDLWVAEATKTRTSAQPLNAVIAVAMGAKTEDFNSCNDMTPSYPRGHRSLDPITDSYVYCSNLVDIKRRKRRRWALRKLRRPARFFKTIFRAVWRAVWQGKSRHKTRANQRLSYKSLRR